MSDLNEIWGLDLGSRMTKAVRLEGDRLAETHVSETGPDPLAGLRGVLGNGSGRRLVATGYGRHLAAAHLACPVVTEIRACARAAAWLCPGCESVIDIGGQDSKAVELRPGGGFDRFEMNDRCAAGTGRFLEVMADALHYPLETFGAPAPITSLCTVFAETEVIGLIARGEDPRRIALGLHAAVADRVAAMASRIRLGARALFIGGVANNPCVVKALRERLDCEVVVPERPELAVALGAALLACHRPSGEAPA